MRKINITFQIPDDDFKEARFRGALNEYIGEKYIIDYRVFPNTEHLKDDKVYKKLVSLKRIAGLELDRYINDKRV